jgi:hypothetical protein
MNWFKNFFFIDKEKQEENKKELFKLTSTICRDMLGNCVEKRFYNAIPSAAEAYERYLKTGLSKQWFTDEEIIHNLLFLEDLKVTIDGKYSEDYKKNLMVSTRYSTFKGLLDEERNLRNI